MLGLALGEVGKAEVFGKDRREVASLPQVVAKKEAQQDVLQVVPQVVVAVLNTLRKLFEGQKAQPSECLA